MIEVPSTVDGFGPRPIAQEPVEQRFAGLIAGVTSYEHLALEAAVRGGRDRVADALLTHPLVGQYELADQLADSLVALNRDFLPWARA